ncbi:hypothetical protein ACHAXR_013328 [Thalassiosira sp. AJA248-18]
MLHILSIAIAAIAFIDGENAVVAFSPPSAPFARPLNSALASRGFSLPSIVLRAQQFNSDDDYLDDEDYEDDEEEEKEPDGLDSLVGKKLGINIGSQLPSLTPEEIADIKAQAQITLDAAIDSRLADIEDLRTELQTELAESRTRMETAAELNVQFEKQNLMEKVDRLTDDFLNKDKDFRESTRKVADADKLAGSMGRGVDWGSWGDVGDGAVVITGSGSGGGGGGGGPIKLLGSMDAARRRGQMLAADGESEEGEFDEQPSAAVENRVLVVVDDKKDKASAPILDRLTTLLNEAFDSNIIVDTYSPTSSNIPIGANNAQTAIIFASSLNDRSSLETLLGRILKRTAPVAGGTVGMPPSHVVIISALGTERTNKMPYSMQNLFGGKLDKLSEIEQGIAAISRSRIAGKQNPLDYTVVKFGDVSSDDKGDGGGGIEIQPGDVVDGEIGPNAAANVLLQAMAYQPYARNVTLCAAGSLSSGASVDTATWNDKFLSLFGPELLRIEAGPGAATGNDSDDGAILDSKFEQLRQYVKQWSGAYEGDRKGTGLTTPVLVRKSRKPASEFDGVVARSGVRILFQTTNTGDRYKTASEERKDDKERNAGGGSVAKKSPSPAKPVMTKAKKEGGVEVLVEKTTDGNIRVRARRCNMDNKTIVKEMSEVVIVKSLKKAVEAWVKARATTGF